MIKPKEPNIMPRSEIFSILFSFGITIINMVICWFNFIITRSAISLAVKSYFSVVYAKMVEDHKASSIPNITRLVDIIAVVLIVIICLGFILWIWNKYENSHSNKNILKTFLVFTGGQLLEISLFCMIILIAAYIIAKGNLELFKPVFNVYKKEFIIGGFSIVFGLTGIIGGGRIK